MSEGGGKDYSVHDGLVGMNGGSPESYNGSSPSVSKENPDVFVNECIINEVDDTSSAEQQGQLQQEQGQPQQQYVPPSPYSAIIAYFGVPQTLALDGEQSSLSPTSQMVAAVMWLV